MKKNFNPHFSITPKTADNLMKIAAARESLQHIPITKSMLLSLRESAQLASIHYSTMIEGNRLSLEKIEKLLTEHKKQEPRTRDEEEIRGYAAAITYINKAVTQKKAVSETLIQTIHALIMGAGNTKVQPTPYRMEQNVIRDGATRTIVYLPPEAKDVPKLMQQLAQWIKKAEKNLPIPLVAGIAHYQLATIHPYYDGNGRTARLLTNFVLHRNGFGMNGIYSLDQYYALNLGAYYEALNIGPSHNYYFGRADADITPWIDYFITGMTHACQKIVKHVLD